MGTFKILCEKLGIMLCFVSSGHPEANGQVERVKKEIKRSIYRYALFNPNTNWLNWLLEIPVGLCIIM